MSCEVAATTPYLKHRIRDNDGTFGPAFAWVTKASSIEEARIAYGAPRMYAVIEHLLGSARRQCLDHMNVLGDRHLERTLKEYTGYFNRDRLHEELGQGLPEPAEVPKAERGPPQLRSVPVLGRLLPPCGVAALR